MLLIQRQKYTSMEQNRKQRNNSSHHGSLSVAKGVKIYNGGKTIF